MVRVPFSLRSRMSALASKPTSKPRLVAVRRRLQAAPNDPPSTKPTSCSEPARGEGMIRTDKVTKTTPPLKALRAVASRVVLQVQIPQRGIPTR
ncbi:adhesin P1 homolog [Mycoplasmoides pneumoniae]|nr:adhesin P1 homolog [Mycoplasmoides pneumoniae]